MFTAIFVIIGVLLIFLLLRITAKPRNFPPGPLSLPLIGGLNHLGNDPFAASLQLHKKYGPIVGIDMAFQRSVIINDYRIIKTAFKNPALTGRPQMGGFQSFHQKNGLVTGILFSEGKVHEDCRGFIVKEFRLTGKKTEATILKQCLEILHHFSSNQGKTISSVRFFNFYSAKVIWSLLARRIIPDDKQIKVANDCFDVLKHVAGVTRAVALIPWLTKVTPSRTGWTEYVENYNNFSATIKKCVDDHKSKPCTVDGQQDLVDRYLEEIAGTFNSDSIYYGDFGAIQIPNWYYQYKKLTDLNVPLLFKLVEFNLGTILSDMVMAGVDTVSEVLSWTFILLINYPKIQEKIQMDIGDVIGKHGEVAKNLVTLAHRPRLPSLEGFLLEVMRFRPTVPWSVGHKATSAMQIDKYTIPKGTTVYANLFSIAQDPQLWTNPEKLDPDRFINVDTGKIEQPPQLEWFVFSTGHRKCPGRLLALDQLFLIVANILSKFSIRGDTWDPRPSINYLPLFVLTPQPFSFVVQKRVVHI